MKYLVITDERSASTTFSHILPCFGLTCMSDPKTRTNQRDELKNYKSNNKTTLLLEWCYLKYDVVKISLVSYNTYELKDMINYCLKHNIKIIIFYRIEIYDRALSKIVATNLNSYHYFNKNIVHKKFKINISNYKNAINDNYIKIKYILTFLEKNKHNYFLLLKETFFRDKNIGINFFKKNFNLDLLNMVEYEKRINTNYQTSEKNKLILNRDEIINFNKKDIRKNELENIIQKLKYNLNFLI